MDDAVIDKTSGATPDEIHAIEEKIRRCHRLASVMTDEKVRLALHRMIREYEAQLPLHRRRRSFMLEH